METEIKLKGVIFARAWWEAAASTLSDAERLAFYDAIFQYGFTAEIPEQLPPIIKPLMAIVRPFLDAEAVKYAERVERNRNNARATRKASGTQSLPMANNTNTSTNTNTNTNTNTISMTSERERFLCLGIIFANGAKDVKAEFERFWNYYESLGWRNNKGAAIARKTAAARMWKPAEIVAEEALGHRRLWSDAMSSGNCCSEAVFVDYREVIIDGEELIIQADHVKQFAAIVDSYFTAPLRRFAAAMGCTAVKYRG